MPKIRFKRRAEKCIEILWTCIGKHNFMNEDKKNVHLYCNCAVFDCMGFLRRALNFLERIEETSTKLTKKILTLKANKNLYLFFETVSVSDTNLRITNFISKTFFYEKKSITNIKGKCIVTWKIQRTKEKTKTLNFFFAVHSLHYPHIMQHKNHMNKIIFPAYKLAKKNWKEIALRIPFR